MTYTPGTQWVGNTEPMQPASAEPPAALRTRKLLTASVTTLLAANPWQTSAQVAATLGCASPDKTSPERTLRRMAQRGAIARKRSPAGPWVYGAAGNQGAITC